MVMTATGHGGGSQRRPQPVGFSTCGSTALGERVGWDGSSALTQARAFIPSLRALADESRLAILLLLADHARTVAELTQLLGIGQTLVSHHLKALRDTGLVAAKPLGRSNEYSLCCEAIAEPVRFLAHIAKSDLEGATSGIDT